MREFGVSRRLKARSAFAGSMLVLQIREDKIPSAAGGWRIRDNTGAPTCIAAAALRNRSGCPASAGHPPDHVRFRFHPVARSCFERREGRSKPRSRPARWSLIGDVETGSFRRGTKLETWVRSEVSVHVSSAYPSSVHNTAPIHPSVPHFWGNWRSNLDQVGKPWRFSVLEDPYWNFNPAWLLRFVERPSPRPRHAEQNACPLLARMGQVRRETGLQWRNWKSETQVGLGPRRALGIGQRRVCESLGSFGHCGAPRWPYLSYPSNLWTLSPRVTSWPWRGRIESLLLLMLAMQTRGHGNGPKTSLSWRGYW